MAFANVMFIKITYNVVKMLRKKDRRKTRLSEKNIFNSSYICLISLNILYKHMYSLFYFIVVGVIP